MTTPTPKQSEKERTWPFSVCPPDNQATPGRHNVRKPNGIVVFSLGVDKLTAREACEALNERWDEVRP